MPLDSGQFQDISAIRADIDRLATLDKVKAWQSKFSRIRAFPGADGQKYDLRFVGSPGFDDDDGFYLTNLILQGGGTLGLAHAGFIEGLERANFRFPAIAGTSAGAIVVGGLVALRGDNILAPVAEGVAQIVRDVPMDTFVDGPRTIRRVVKRAAAGRSLRNPLYWPGILAALRRVLRTRGLNSGMAFEAWMKSIFAENKLYKMGDLENRINTIARDLRAAKVSTGHDNPFNALGDGIKGTDIFKMISTAMPTGSKFCLPRDLTYLDPEYQQLSPAKLVRMSMSIPLFFEPTVMKTNPATWPNYVARNIAAFVSDRAAWEMAELRELIFLDGGLFSNLPTDELIGTMSSEIASLSVPLVSSETNVTIQNTNTPRALVSDAGALINAVRLQRDRDAHNRIAQQAANEPVKRQLVTKIDTGRAHWLNFTMSKSEKTELYLAGLLRARDLLRKGV